MADILIIDDESLLREELSSLLKHEGYSVEVATDGADGLKKFAAKPARLVVTDVIMPEKEGIETICKLRAMHPDVHIIAISGGGRRGNVQFLDVARRLGADAALPKPFTRAQITSLIRDFLHARGRPYP